MLAQLLRSLAGLRVPHPAPAAASPAPACRVAADTLQREPGRPPPLAPFPCRPGCTFLTVDLRLDHQLAASLLRDSAVDDAGGAGAGPSAQLPHRSSSKQLDAEEDADGAAAAGGGGSSGGRAALLQRLVGQLLQRRSMGDAAAAGPMLLQLGTQHLAVAAGGRLLRCMPLPAPAPAQAAAATTLAAAIPHLTAVTPSVLVLHSEQPSSGACEPAVLALTGHGLWGQAGAHGLVLCRQHGARCCCCCCCCCCCYGRDRGIFLRQLLPPPSLNACCLPLSRAAGRHLPVEVWGSAPGSGGAPGALVVAVLGLRPGSCELEVQRGSVLGSSRPLLVLPADMAAAAAELRAPQDGQGGAASDALLRDVGAVAAWVAHREQGPPQPPHAPFCTEDELSSGWSSSEEEEEEEEEGGVGEGGAGRGEAPVPLLPAASVAGLAQHAAAHSLLCGWQATAAMLESAAEAAQAAAGAEAAAVAAAAVAAAAPGWLPGSTQLQRDEHALDFDYWAPLWRQQLQREEGQAGPPAVPDGQPTAWWQAAGSGASSPQRRQLSEERWDALTVEGIKAALSTQEPGRSTRVLRGWVAAAVLALVAATVILAVACARL